MADTLWSKFSTEYGRDLNWDFENQPQGAQRSFGISSTEAISGIANRFLYSTAYKMFYLLIAGSSLICLFLVFTQACTPQFLFLETFINVALVLEVGVRILAQRMAYFKFIANIIDVFLVLICFITLFFLKNGCSSGASKLEEELDTILLVVRNAVQFVRLIVMLNKNPTTANRSNYLNIVDVEQGSASGASVLGSSSGGGTFDFD